MLLISRPSVAASRILDCPHFMIRRTHYDAGASQPAHHHERSSISLVLRGSIEEAVGEETRRGRALSCVVKPAGTIHADRYGPSGAALLQVELKSDRALGPRSHWHWRSLGGCTRAFLRLARLLTAEDPPEARLSAVISEVIAELAPQIRAKPPAPPWLRLVSETLSSTRIGDRIRVDDLAHQAGVHPVYLTRQFRRHFGETVRTRIQRRRVQAAAALVTQSGRRLTDVAYSLGYADQAHFCREFRKVTGVRASELRRLARD